MHSGVPKCKGCSQWQSKMFKPDFNEVILWESASGEETEAIHTCILMSEKLEFRLPLYRNVTLLAFMTM